MNKARAALATLTPTQQEIVDAACDITHTIASAGAIALFLGALFLTIL